MGRGFEVCWDLEVMLAADVRLAFHNLFCSRPLGIDAFDDGPGGAMDSKSAA